MSTVVEKIEELQKQQASKAIVAQEKYRDLMSLLNECEDLRSDASKKLHLQSNASKELQRQLPIVAQKVELLHNDLLSTLDEWQELDSQIYDVVQGELREIKDRVIKVKKLPMPSPPQEENKLRSGKPIEDDFEPPTSELLEYD
ncbi:MAG: hypothetical protein QOF61_1450 [Acidobacteriota bacterium]|nr:hypothetical protein [Acidobacteriota bacterium]